MLTEKFFDTGSLVINYAEGAHNGPPLVLLHGATARWQELNPLIEKLEHHFHVFACDLRGHGKSGRATSYRAVDMFPDTAIFIRDHINAPTLLIGHSGGAIASMGATIQIPGLIRRLILLDPPLYLREESIRSNYVYNIFLGMYTFMTRQRTAQEVFSELFPGIDEVGIRNLEGIIGQVDPEFGRTLIEDRFFESLDMQTILNQLNCPSLMLYGEMDKGGIVRDKDVEFFLRHTLNSTAVQIKDAGHLLQFDQSARVLELISTFIGRSGDEI
jgi:pimeloyl-ACP methyl ester carboxylesterase